jgi:hypothetical protein
MRVWLNHAVRACRRRPKCCPRVVPVWSRLLRNLLGPEARDAFSHRLPPASGVNSQSPRPNVTHGDSAETPSYANGLNNPRCNRVDP